MANTFTLSPVPVGNTLPAIRMLGAVPFSLATTETYATATSGFPITVDDIEGFLDNFGLQLQVKAEDIVSIIGISTLGYTLRGLKQADNSWKCELWNGTTEIGDGALNATITGLILFSAGSPS